MRGKLIVIEGTDCSGKETQSNKLFDRLLDENIKVSKSTFPRYDTPTGKIVGGPYLGKLYITNGWFPEGAENVDPKVAMLYYAADRLYNIKEINKLLAKGFTVLLDRYTSSNMAHQGGKIKDEKERNDVYELIDNLEYKLLGLPKADITIFLHLPFKYSFELKQNRKELPDQHEASIEHLENAEKAYVELAKLYEWKTVECVKDGKIRTIDDIHEDIFNIVNNLDGK